MNRLRKGLRDSEWSDVSRAEFLQTVLGRLTNDVGLYFRCLQERIDRDPGFRAGLWAGVRMLMPVVEAIARVQDEEPWDFLQNHLGVQTPHLVWDMYRHSLIHSDVMRRASYQGKHVIWEIAIGGRKHSFGAGKISIDLLKLYDDLVAYLQGEIHKGDQTTCRVVTGFEYEKASPTIIGEFGKL